MAFTPIETIALIVIIASAIKMLILLVNPRAWMGFAKKVWGNKALAQLIGLVLALIIFYYLRQAGISIVLILAVTAFVASMLIIGLASEVESLIKKYESLVKRGQLWKQYWLYALLWIILLVWGVKELFY